MQKFWNNQNDGDRTRGCVSCVASAPNPQSLPSTKGANIKTTFISVVLAIVLTNQTWPQHTPMYDDRPKITVTGESVVNVKPDKTVITLGIETWDTEIMCAKQRNNNILKKTVAVVKECGVAEKDMQTDYLSIEPR